MVVKISLFWESSSCNYSRSCAKLQTLDEVSCWREISLIYLAWCMWCHWIAITRWLEGEISLLVADVESFAERMFSHAPTCLDRHCCASHRTWPVMFVQPMDDAKEYAFYHWLGKYKESTLNIFLFCKCRYAPEHAYVIKKHTITLSALLWLMQICDRPMLPCPQLSSMACQETSTFVSRLGSRESIWVEWKAVLCFCRHIWLDTLTRVECLTESPEHFAKSIF